jgi:cobalamin-dependent methionine synthase I
MVNNMQPFSGSKPGILFATLSGESHEFGILLTCLLAASQNCSCFYIGPDLPWTDLHHASDKLKPAVITLSAVYTPPSSFLLENLAQLAHETPHSIQLWIGGPGALYLQEQQRLPERYQYLVSLDDFYNKLAALIVRGQA